MYRQNEISTIVIQVSDWPENYGDDNWRPFKGKLPAGIKKGITRKSIEERLGKPIKPNSSTWKRGALMIWVHFEPKTDVVSELYVSLELVEAIK